jgi:hypothetical protein
MSLYSGVAHGFFCHQSFRPGTRSHESATPGRVGPVNLTITEEELKREIVALD